jgi:hypothetical protein
MITSEIEILTSIAETEFGKLSETQLNWKPEPDSWSIGSCLHHIIVSNEKYFPALESVAAGKYKMNFWEKINPLTSYTGRQMINSLGREVKKRYSAPLIFRPATKFSVTILDEFRKHQEKLILLFEKLEKNDPARIVITSPVASLVTLRVMDAMKLISVHEQRHVSQAISVKQNPSFIL